MKLLKTNKDINGVLLLLIAGLVVGLFGSIVGTYAWYENLYKASVIYNGTAIGRSENIEIGLFSDIRLYDFASKHNLIEDYNTIQGSFIYWSKTGELNSDAVQEYESLRGYASTKMSATSSSTFNAGESFALKTSPKYLSDNDSKRAEKNEYSFLKLALKNQNKMCNYFLSDSTIECEHNIGGAVRVHFQDSLDQSTSFIYSPSYNESGYTNVGGILNLNSTGDDLYDYENNSNVEFIYGKVDNLVVTEEKYSGEKKYDPKDCDCFKSNHKKDLYVQTYTPQKANYFGRNDTINNRLLAYTNPVSKVAILNVSVYLEGWDLNCTDAGVSYSYNLSLKFSSKSRSNNE